MTSSTHDADLKGNKFRRTIQPQGFIAVAFIFSKLGGGRGLPEAPPIQKVEKKPGLDRVRRFLLGELLLRYLIRAVFIYSSIDL